MSIKNIEFIKRFLLEGREYLNRGDPVQASEKLYKAAEETVKSLSANYAKDIFEEAAKRGRWTAGLLFDAVGEISKTFGREFRNYWDTAWTLHVEGFHERRLSIRHVQERVEEIEELVKIAEGRGL